MAGRCVEETQTHPGAESLSWVGWGCSDLQVEADEEGGPGGKILVLMGPGFICWLLMGAWAKVVSGIQITRFYQSKLWDHPSHSKVNLSLSLLSRESFWIMWLYESLNFCKCRGVKWIPPQALQASVPLPCGKVTAHPFFSEVISHKQWGPAGLCDDKYCTGTHVHRPAL